MELVEVRNDEQVFGLDLLDVRLTVVVLADDRFKGVLVLSAIDVEVRLVLLVGDAVVHLGPEHHLVALHEVVHHVLHLRNQGLGVNQVEIDQLVGGQLEPLVALDVVDEPPLVNLVVHLPSVSFASFVIEELVKQNFA